MTRNERKCRDVRVPPRVLPARNVRGQLPDPSRQNSRTGGRRLRWMLGMCPAIAGVCTLLLIVGATGADDGMLPPARWDDARPADELGQWDDGIHHQPGPVRLAQQLRFPNELEHVPPPILSGAQRGIYDEIQPIGQSTVGIEPALDPQGQSNRPEDNDHAADVFAQMPTLRYGASPTPVGIAPSYYLATADFCHFPLYFEEAKLERYGHCHGIVQPAISAAHFFGTIPALPYKMAVERPTHCLRYDYPYEAGRWAPPYRQSYPWRWDASLAEVITVVALIAIFP